VDTVDLDALRQILSAIVDAVEVRAGGSRVALSVDDYWDVSWEDRYRMDRVPESLIVGSLSEDQSLLKEALEEGMPTMMVATWAARVLEAVGNQVAGMTAEGDD
jgi:hypothetical protein